MHKNRLDPAEELLKKLQTGTYKNYKDGNIKLSNNVIYSIRCPKSFKNDAFEEIPCNETDDCL